MKTSSLNLIYNLYNQNKKLLNPNWGEIYKLAHFGLVTSYGDIDLGEHWLR